MHERDGALHCPNGEVYPIVAGVAVVVQGATIAPRREALSEAVADQLMDALGLAGAHRSSIAQAFSHQFTFPEEWMQVEADQYLYRVAGTHEGLRRALSLENVVPADFPVNIDARPFLSTIFSIDRVGPGEYFAVNVRIENRGECTLSSDGPRPITLSYHWIDAAGAAHHGQPTPLLDDLRAGQSITMPVFVIAPPEAGSFKLVVRVVQDGVAALKVGWVKRILGAANKQASRVEQPSIDFDVVVGAGPATTDEPEWTMTGRQFDYFADHDEAVRLLGEWQSALFSRPVDRIVELGGNASPMIGSIAAAQKCNVDIDPFGMIVGNLLQSGSEQPMRYVIADGMAMPLAARSVDMLIMFATFHHFPDPIGLLLRLRHSVCDDGLICLLCEPIGHVHRDTVYAEYLTEIRRGVNEQSFALWEYRQMFDAAKLDVVAAQIDIGSAKFALRPRAAAHADF